MRVDLMRRIDSWVGVPLCAAASAWLRLWWWLRPMPSPPMRRVLFIELSEMGSTVLAQPAMRKISQQSNAELFFAIFQRNRASLDLIGTVPSQNIYCIREDSFWNFVWDTIGFLSWARKNEIDTVIDLELFSRYTGLLTGLSGASRRAGFYRYENEGLYRGGMLTHRVAYNPHIHIAKNFVAQVDALLSAKPTRPYSKTRIDDAQLKYAIARPSAAAIDDMSKKIHAVIPAFDPVRHRLVLINSGGNEFIPHRRWMPARFAETIHRIVDTYSDVHILITGAQNEAEHTVAIAAGVNHPRCASFAGSTIIAELPALYAMASLMITSDSGPAHFAAACGVATVVLFGPETPKLYKPLGNAHVIYAGLACSPCVSALNHRKTTCTDNVCMQAITVDEVFEAVSKLLTR